MKRVLVRMVRVAIGLALAASVCAMGPGTRIHGHLRHGGSPVLEAIDLVVLVYTSADGGSWQSYRRFDALAVSDGRFVIDLAVAATRNAGPGPLFLEFRLRPTGDDEVFRTLRPRLPLTADRSTRSVSGDSEWHLDTVVDAVAVESARGRDGLVAVREG